LIYVKKISPWPISTKRNGITGGIEVNKAHCSFAGDEQEDGTQCALKEFGEACFGGIGDSTV
jgi:hypothetical protein